MCIKPGRRQHEAGSHIPPLPQKNHPKKKEKGGGGDHCAHTLHVHGCTHAHMKARRSIGKSKEGNNSGYSKFSLPNL